MSTSYEPFAPRLLTGCTSLLFLSLFHESNTHALTFCREKNRHHYFKRFSYSKSPFVGQDKRI